MASSLEKITIRGFKSIRALEAFELKGLNLLIGANGAGKSNFVDFFRFLNAYLQGRLHDFVESNGRADAFLFNGPKATTEILVHLESSPYQLNLILKPLLTGELTELSHVEPRILSNIQENDGDAESPSTDPIDTSWASAFSSSVYHFNDTSNTAAMRRDQSLRDWRELKPEAGNIAAFLYRLRQTDKDRYEQIRYHVRLIAPYFDDFMLQPTPPHAIVIDEPELGLHPFALGVLASMLRQASDRSQIIVSTQSASLLDNFEPEEVIVVDRENGASRFRRLDAGPLQDWLQDYSLGQLWQKNVLEGGPVYE